jgi:rfaE bifunctional protein kinase chain/domain
MNTSQDYLPVLQRFAGRRLIVLGDLMMDEYVWGRTSRISPEAPVMVIDVERETRVPGGAANVVNNLLTLGANVAVIGVVGDDEAGDALKADLEAAGADVSGIVTDSSRPTTRKTRVVAHSQQVLRVDREQTYPITAAMAAALNTSLVRLVERADVLLVSEYNKGVFTPDVAASAVGLAKQNGVLLTSNPKPPNVRLLAGADAVSLNQFEAQALGNDSRFLIPAEEVTPNAPFAGQEGLEVAGRSLVQSLGIETLVVTLGSKGMTLFHADGSADHIPPHRIEVYDAAGAGDTVISTFSLALAAGASKHDAAVLAVTAAACAVRKVGVETVTVEEIIAELH